MAQPVGVAVLASVLVLAAAACGGGPAGPGQTGPGASGRGASGTGGPGSSTSGATVGVSNDVCSLLTVVEVSSALSTDPLTATGTSGTSGDGAKCTYWIGPDDPALKAEVITKGAITYFRSQHHELQEAISGVGDEAFYDSGDRAVFVLVGETYVALTAIYASDSNTTRDALTTLAKLVVARLTNGDIPPEAQLTARPVITADESCDLLSAEEAASVVGQPLTKSASEFTTDFCYFTAASGEVAMTTYFHAKLGIAAWDDIVANMDSEPIAGIGNQAAYEASTGTLYVLSGDTVLNVVVYNLTDALGKDRQLMEIMLLNL